jgi:hypothetical protein
VFEKVEDDVVDADSEVDDAELRLPSSLVLGLARRLGRLEFMCVFRSVSSDTVFRVLGVLVPELGVCAGDEGLEIAVSYVGRSSEAGVRAGVRTAVLYDGVRARASMS